MEVPREMSFWRLDRVLSHMLPGWSRKDVGSLVMAGSVSCNGKVIRKGTLKVVSGDILEVVNDILHTVETERLKRMEVTNFAYTGSVSAVIPEDIPLEIVYEDDDVLVVDKPSGMVIHPAYANTSGTLANAIAGYFRKKNIPVVKRIGLVHRLDKEVSGLVVIAKNDDSLRELSKQFSGDGIVHGNIDIQNKAWKYYRALVDEVSKGAVERSGLQKGKRILIEGWVSRSMHDRRKYSFRKYSDRKPGSDREKYAASYMTLNSNENNRIEVLIQIITGRTHQIRVQLASLGLPIVGDSKYGISRGYMKLRCERVSLVPTWRVKNIPPYNLLRENVSICENKKVGRIVIEKKIQM